ncbi:hypothetical protein WMY93_034242 [Mugilogobius chulae]|uniref:Uncharacterized protein n=1 Tax=Mugilogobius chulae TaxID=88201 RepID=A0AAW0MGG5_9GOBI
MTLMVNSSHTLPTSSDANVLANGRGLSSPSSFTLKSNTMSSIPNSYYTDPFVPTAILGEPLLLLLLLLLFPFRQEVDRRKQEVDRK